MSAGQLPSAATPPPHLSEAADWNAASDWVRSQVVVTFRHRAIASRLSSFPCVANAEAGRQLDDVVLEIILPENLQHPKYMCATYIGAA